MKSNVTRTVAALALCLFALGLTTGCDKAEKAVQNTGLAAGSDLTRLVGEVMNTVAGIKDVDSARAALPALQQVDGDLVSLVDKVKSMAPDQKSKLTEMAATALPKLQSAFEKITALPGVGEIVGPTLTSLQAKFNSLI